jgi:hypothetical protein
MNLVKVKGEKAQISEFAKGAKLVTIQPPFNDLSSQR